MQRRTRILIGLSLTLVIVGFSLLLLGYSLTTKSFPQTTGSVTLDGLKGVVRIERDSFGMPHIFAASDEDAFFAAGFVHAQDRLWQMELIRRAGMGRLAEVLGAPALKTDRLFRTLGLWRLARSIAAQLDGESKTALESYAAGVNAMIRSSAGHYAVEFDMLGIEPEPWFPEHSILLSKLMAWELNYSRWVDVTYGFMVARVGEERARDLYPGWPAGAPTIIAGNQSQNNLNSLGQQLLDADRSYRELMGNGAFESGSNAWVVAGSRSTTGKPILANDPHLVLMAPGRWYEVQLSSPTLDVTGASIPGSPFVVIGRNRNIAWGVTNAMFDDQDFYVEEVDSVLHPTMYRLGEEWRPVLKEVDTILIKDELPIVLTSYRTHRGPVVNRIEPSTDVVSDLLTMRWTGHEVSNDVRAFLMINRARSWKEFRDALKHFNGPAQNFVYADAGGNIGYQTGGKLPRRSVNRLTGPLPGNRVEFDWEGFVPFEEMPRVFNPPEGYIVTANNRIVHESYPYYISQHWEPEWRAGRIVDLIKRYERCSVEDFQRFQIDLLSLHAWQIVPVILKAYEGSEPENENVRTALNYFRNWNFVMRQEDVATTLFQAFIIRSIHNTFSDEMGPFVSRMYDTLAAMPLVALNELLKKDSSAWFDDVRTASPETKNQIVRKSLKEALDDLAGSLGGELKEWRWGRVHEVEFAHVFGENPLLRPIFNVGTFPVGGSHSTVWKGDFRIGQPFKNHVGPSTRQIFDLSDPNNTRSVTPPGQSGHLFHKNYQDQVPLWLHGAFRKVPMDRDRVEQASHDLLVLEPNN